jgi:repressor of nif and glnA expression
MAENKRDLLSIFGTILMTAGIAVWGVYAILRFGLGWPVTVQQFLPYHLTGIIPGLVLRRHRFFSGK